MTFLTLLAPKGDVPIFYGGWFFIRNKFSPEPNYAVFELTKI